MRIYVLEHPPYSPDLAPREFILFPCVKKKAYRQKDKPRQKLRVDIFNLLKEIPEKAFGEIFKDWLKTNETLCICQKEYF